MLKKIFIFTLAMIAFAAPTRAADPQALHRLATLVDYIAADYGHAVVDGKIIVETEYREQLTLAQDAEALAASLEPATERARLGEAIRVLEQAIEARRPDAEVVGVCRAIRELLMQRFGLRLVPNTPPSLARAQELFRVACAKCHGEDGRANTEEARRFKPQPISFHDRERMERVSPELAFSAVTFGIRDTAMPSFEECLSAADRWSLAFFVLGIRHEAPPAQTVLPRRPTLGELAGLSDQELAGRFAVSQDRLAPALAELRRRAPYVSTGDRRFTEARRLLEQLASAPRERRRELAIAAYLDGIEPHEAELRTQDPALADEIERGFLALRGSIERDEDLGRGIAALLRQLDRAEERATGKRVAFFAAFAIALREGLEAALVVAALLAFLRKSGRQRLARPVHLGWMTAIPLGVATWWGAGLILHGARRELAEAVVAFLAAGTILWFNHWVLGQKSARRWLSFLEQRVTQASGGRALFALAFFAAFREAFEIVLFFRALLLDSEQARVAVAAGATTGVAVLVGVVVGVGRLGRRLNPRPVLLASSLLLAALSIDLVGRGVRALQEAGLCGLTPLPLPELRAIGFFPSLQGIVAQALMVVAIAYPLVVDRLRRLPAVSPAPSSEGRSP